MAHQTSYIITGMESLEELRLIGEQRSSVLVVNLNSIKTMMSAFLTGRMSADTLQDMAEFFEMNEAIVTSADEAAQVNEIVFMLANPEINFPNSTQKVRALLEALG